MKRAVIISGGAVSDYKYVRTLVREGDFVICADSGYDHAVKMGLRPDVVVGDFDSVRGEIPPEIPCVPYPARKNQTDTEIALEYAREKGFADFLLLGATGNRLDHTLANVLLLKTCAARNETVVICDEFNKLMPLTAPGRLCLENPGTIVSLVPITDCTGVTTENLEYPLRDAELFAGTGLGISNIVIKEPASVTVKSGFLLVIVVSSG